MYRALVQNINHMKKIIRILFIFFILILLVVFGAIWLFKNKLGYNDSPIVTHQNFPLEGEKNTIMYLFPHPDDEITVAGTICLLSENPNNQLIGIYLTRGEAGKTGGLVSKEELGKERTKEIQNAAKVVGYDALEVFDFPDSGLPRTDSSTAKAEILRMIYLYKPNIIVSFDDKVGFYGHPDHLMTGKWIKSICEENAKVDTFPVKQLYCPTLSTGMLEIALSISGTFRRNYPKDASKGLPAPSFAVDISRVGHKKLQAIEAHRTQKHIFDDVFPFHDKISPTWYFKLFDREYFALVFER